MELPKIKKCNHKDYKYAVGRDGRGWWQVSKTLYGAIKLWFWYLFR